MRSPRPADPKLPFERTVMGWGVSARFSASSAALLKSALLGLPAGFRPSRAAAPDMAFEIRITSGHIEVREGGPALNLGRSRRILTRYVESQMETLASTRSPKFAFLHAGCVEIDGRVILFPGRSGAGKSTLVMEFLRRGAAYLSDDLVPVDSKLRVHPFPRLIGVRPAIGGSSTRASYRGLGAEVARGAFPLAMVWSGRYDPLASGSSFDRRRGGAAFAELLAHCPGAQIKPEIIIPILTGIARSVPVFAGSRGEAGEMVEAIRSRPSFT